MRTVLDEIRGRLGESREVSRYMIDKAGGGLDRLPGFVRGIVFFTQVGQDHVGQAVMQECFQQQAVASLERWPLRPGMLCFRGLNKV